MITKKKFLTFLNFILVGCFATGIDYSIYQILITNGLNLNLSKGVSYFGGLVSAYVGNTYFTFRAKNSNAFKFAGVYFIGFMVNVITNFLLNRLLSTETDDIIMLSWLIATTGSALSNFFMLQRWVYKKNRTHE
jgi:putative flippase GtrA